MSIRVDIDVVKSLPTNRPLVTGTIYKVEQPNGKLKVYTVNSNGEPIEETGMSVQQENKLDGLKTQAEITTDIGNSLDEANQYTEDYTYSKVEVEEIAQKEVFLFDTIADFRNISVDKLSQLVDGKVNCAMVLGYYTKGDTPNPIDYFVSSTPESDNGGSVIEINNVKFEHTFIGSIDCKYFGVFNNVYNPSVISGIIEHASNKGIKDVVLTSDISINIPTTYDGIGIVMKSNVNLHLRGQISVVSNSNDRYRVISLTNVSNCTIVGYPTGGIIGDVEEHTGTTGEWGNGVYIGDNCSNITIQDLNITKCWGDGIYIGGFQSDEDYSTDINIINNNLTTNRRQGVSIAKGKNINISGNVIKDTGAIRGTFPMDGIDIEPNLNNKVNNVKIFNNSFINNKGYDFQIYCNTDNSKVSNVSFYDNDIENSQPKFNSTINTLVSISGRRLDANVFPENIVVRNNTFEVKDVTHLNSILYSYASTNGIMYKDNVINSESYVTTFRFDTVSNVTVDNNSHDKTINFIQLLTGGNKFIIKNNKVFDVQNTFITASSSNNIDVYDNIIDGQINSANRIMSFANMNTVHIINNTFSNIKRGVLICTSTINNFIFKLNTVLEYNTSSTTNEPMLYITAGTASSVNNIISNNTIIQTNNTVSYGIRVSSVSPHSMTNTIIKDNELIGTYSVRISNEAGGTVSVSDKNIIQDASIGNSGLVKQGVPQVDITVANLVSIATADAIDLPTALVLLNEVKAKYNLNVTLTNAIKTSQNTELANQRTAGQQST